MVTGATLVTAITSPACMTDTAFTDSEVVAAGDAMNDAARAAAGLAAVDTTGTAAGHTAVTSAGDSTIAVLSYCDSRRRRGIVQRGCAVFRQTSRQMSWTDCLVLSARSKMLLQFRDVISNASVARISERLFGGKRSKSTMVRSETSIVFEFLEAVQNIQ